MQPYGLPTSPTNSYAYSFGQYGQPANLMPFGGPTVPLSFGSAFQAPTPSSPSMPGGTSPVMAAAMQASGTGAEADPGWFQKSFLNSEGGLNFGNIGSLMKGIGAIGSVWGGIQANKIAKDVLNFQKQSYETNLANSISSYNMSLEDRAYARAKQNGTGTDSADRYISRHKLGA